MLLIEVISWMLHVPGNGLVSGMRRKASLTPQDVLRESREDYT